MARFTAEQVTDLTIGPGPTRHRSRLSVIGGGTHHGLEIPRSVGLHSPALTNPNYTIFFALVRFNRDATGYLDVNARQFRGGSTRLGYRDERNDLSPLWERQGYISLDWSGVGTVVMRPVDSDSPYELETHPQSPNTVEQVIDTISEGDVVTLLISDQPYPEPVIPPKPAPPDPSPNPPTPQPDPEPEPEFVQHSETFLIEAEFLPGQWVDISTELHGKLGTRIKRKEILHKELRSAVNTCEIQLFGSERIAQIFNYTPRDLPIRIRKNGLHWFNGFIRGDIGASFRGGGICTLKAVDRSYILNDEIDIYLGEDQDGTPWTQLPISKTSGDEGLLTRILVASGVRRDDLFMLDIEQVIPRFAVSADDDKKWKQILEPILFEYGYALNVRPSGAYEMFDLFPREVTPVAKLDKSYELEYSGSGNIQRKLRLIPTNSTRVIWYPQEIKESIRLFELTQGARDNFPCFVRVTAGRFYPQDASEDLAVYSVYQRIDGFDIVSAYNQKFEWEQLKTIPEGIAAFEISPIILRREEHHPLFSDIRLQAADSGDRGVITKYSITGDAVVRDNLREHRWVTYGVAGSKNVKELKTKWIVNPADAERLSSGYTNWSTWAVETVVFEGEGFRINEIYDIVDRRLTNIDGLYRIVEITENDIGRQDIVAERIPRGRELPR